VLATPNLSSSEAGRRSPLADQTNSNTTPATTTRSQRNSRQTPLSMLKAFSSNFRLDE
jgi:hypothetical protein